VLSDNGRPPEGTEQSIRADGSVNLSALMWVILMNDPRSHLSPPHGDLVIQPSSLHEAPRPVATASKGISPVNEETGTFPASSMYVLERSALTHYHAIGLNALSGEDSGSNEEYGSGSESQRDPVEEALHIALRATLEEAERNSGEPVVHVLTYDLSPIADYGSPMDLGDELATIAE
jgi:hypothetical protein